MTRQQLFAAFFFAVLLFLLYQFYLIFSVFVTPLAWAALLALVFYPAQVWLTRQLRNRSGLSAFLLTTIVIAVVMVPTVFLTILLVTETGAAYERLTQLKDSGELAQWLQLFQGRLLGMAAKYLPVPDLDRKVDLPSLALSISGAVSGFVVAQATGALKNALLFITNFLLTTVALFFFFRDGERMANSLRAVIPMEPQHKDTILSRVYNTLTAVVHGTIATAAAQGFLAGIGYWIVGVPFAVLLGCATAFLSFLPMGAALVWIAVDIYLFVADTWTRGIILLIWGTLIVSGVDNVIRPLIIGGRAQIPTVFLFFGILGGLQVYGFLGMFVGPVLIAILVAFVQIYREQYATA